MFLWLMVALKIPICALFYLVWWATRAPEATDESGDDRISRPEPDHPRPTRPRPPRRGPHADLPPKAPKRVRSLRGRRLKPTHR
jgi:hypothetical protein